MSVNVVPAAKAAVEIKRQQAASIADNRMARSIIILPIPIFRETWPQAVWGWLRPPKRSTLPTEKYTILPKSPCFFCAFPFEILYQDLP
jgi:hypothetical protein